MSESYQIYHINTRITTFVKDVTKNAYTATTGKT